MICRQLILDGRDEMEYDMKRVKSVMNDYRIKKKGRLV